MVNFVHLSVVNCMIQLPNVVLVCKEACTIL